MHCYRLTFTEPLLLSKTGTDYADIELFIHSDTLKSALLVNAFQVGLATDQAKDFLDSFLISSAFPYYHHSLFFPKPYFKLPINANDNETKKNKQLKKIAFIEKESFFTIIQGGELNDRTHKYYDKTGRFLFHQEQEKEITIYKEEDVVHQTGINKQKDLLYATVRLRFNKEAGLYFLVQWQNKEYEALFNSALSLLADNGLGAYRTVGNGKFSYKKDETEFQIANIADANAQLNLSLYIPATTEIENLKKDELLSYNLLKRGGYIASPEGATKMSWRKKTIFSFAEGSIFNTTPLKGDCVDLKPEGVLHPIYREGRSIFIPIKTPKEQHHANN